MIGQSFAGGYYVGKIAVGGGGIATHYLIVAPKATGQSLLQWGSFGVTTGITSDITGPANNASLASFGNAYQAANFCKNLAIGGYTDWYLPSKNELEVLFYFLRPYTTSFYSQDTTSGSNANAVSPEPISTNYTSTVPAQTTAAAFISGGSEAFNSDYGYWTSTEADNNRAWRTDMGSGSQLAQAKNSSFYARAVRRIPI